MEIHIKYCFNLIFLLRLRLGFGVGGIEVVHPLTHGTAPYVDASVVTLQDNA